jgi:allantoin racemase
MARILVINPNSSTSVTAAMDGALAPLRFAGGPTIDTMTLAEGPPGIESQRDVESVVLPLADLVRRETADAYVIGCFSDPGLALARDVSDKPVFGIAESAFLAALGFGRRFGIVAILDRSIPRHLRYLRQLGLEDRLAADIAINTGVAGLEDEASSVERIVAVGKRLRDEHGASSMILGCASMGRYRAEVEQRVGIAVIDPTQAAVSQAIAAVALGYLPVR